MDVACKQGNKGLPGQHRIPFRAVVGQGIQLVEQILHDRARLLEVAVAIGLLSGEVVRLEVAVHPWSSQVLQLYPVAAPLQLPTAWQVTLPGGLLGTDGPAQLLQLTRWQSAHTLALQPALQQQTPCGCWQLLQWTSL